jgi:hypothetical protein
MTSVYLVFGPTRTRDYTGTLLDLSSDLFVPCSQLVAVCGTRESAVAERKRVVERLRDEAPPARGLTYHIALETGLYNEMLPKLWFGATRVHDRELEGYVDSDPLPSTVWVVFRTHQATAWDGVEYQTLEPYGVFAQASDALAIIKPYIERIAATANEGRLSSLMREFGFPFGDFLDIAEIPLTGVPAEAKAK